MQGAGEVFTEVMLVGAKVVFQAVFRSQALWLPTESGNDRAEGPALARPPLNTDVVLLPELLLR